MAVLDCAATMVAFGLVLRVAAFAGACAVRFLACARAMCTGTGRCMHKHCSICALQAHGVRTQGIALLVLGHYGGSNLCAWEAVWATACLDHRHRLHGTASAMSLAICYILDQVVAVASFGCGATGHLGSSASSGLLLAATGIHVTAVAVHHCMCPTGLLGAWTALGMVGRVAAVVHWGAPTGRTAQASQNHDGCQAIA